MARVSKSIRREVAAEASILSIGKKEVRYPAEPGRFGKCLYFAKFPEKCIVCDTL